MRSSFRITSVSLVAAATLALGGCAGPFGGDPLGGLGGIFGDILGGGNSGNYGNNSSTQSFERAAVEACGQQAARYGSARVEQVERRSQDSLRVRGTVNVNGRNERFTCTFRSDGRITEFDID